MKYAFVCLLLTLTFLVKAEVGEIPHQDLKHIKYLFEELVNSHDFSYTVFGSKPMSLADFSVEVPPNLPLRRWIRSKYLMYRRRSGLKAWYKHRDKFDLKDFIFLDEERDWLPCLVLVLISKKNMLRILHEHESIFAKELGASFTPESFLAKLEKRELSMATATNKSQRLIGIILGYGVRNATLFQERYDTMKAIWKREKENLPEDTALTKKIADIEAQCGDFSELDADAIIHPLYFLADVSHPETIALQKKYEQERQQIISLRKKHNFMDLVLERLCSHSS
ncbi:MAG: hypothetical protein K940chlam9_00993 [Chlamydiae bacterium]|nr:hypothetical protein [Chlamydiota bacterium]